MNEKGQLEKGTHIDTNYHHFQGVLISVYVS